MNGIFTNFSHFAYSIKQMGCPACWGGIHLVSTPTQLAQKSYMSVKSLIVFYQAAKLRCEPQIMIEIVNNGL